jgi:ribonuclease Z
MVKRIEEITRDKSMPRLSKLMFDIQDYHTSGIEAAEVANEAGAKLLVLYHFTPPVLNLVAEKIFTRGISDVRKDGWIMSHDGTLVTLPIADKSVVDVGRID